MESCLCFFFLPQEILIVDVPLQMGLFISFLSKSQKGFLIVCLSFKLYRNIVVTTLLLSVQMGEI